jgi:hypothetical protein
LFRCGYYQQVVEMVPQFSNKQFKDSALAEPEGGFSHAHPAALTTGQYDGARRRRHRRLARRLGSVIESPSHLILAQP